MKAFFKLQYFLSLDQTLYKDDLTSQMWPVVFRFGGASLFRCFWRPVSRVDAACSVTAAGLQHTNYWPEEHGMCGEREENAADEKSKNKHQRITDAPVVKAARDDAHFGV